MRSRPWEIYTLSDPRTNLVRYVGMTFRAKARLREHVSRAKRGGKTHRDNWIRSLIAQGLRPTYQIVEHGSGHGWKEAEQKWIAYYRSLTDLVNLTDGGEGAPGYVPTPELRRKWSEQRAGIPYPPGRVSAMKGRRHTPEALKKIQFASKGRRMPDSMKRKLSAFRKNNPISTEQRHKMSAASLETRQADEYRQKAIAAHPGKEVVCVETGEVFASIRAASRALGISKGAIQFALKRMTPCKGHTLRHGTGKENTHRERLFVSPHCLHVSDTQLSMFG